jgi:hypothetical protein
MISGDSHGSGSRPSSAHMNVEFGLLALNVNVALVSVVVGCAGPSWIVVIGGVTSPTIHSHSSHSIPTWPCGDVASTANRWSPPARPL